MMTCQDGDCGPMIRTSDMTDTPRGVDGCREKIMIAFHGDAQLKRDLLMEVADHRLHDQIIKGTYGQGSNGDWKGCAVACSIHSLNRKNGRKRYDTSDHSAFEPLAGVPRQLAHLQDYIFERLPEPKHIDWPERFWAAIQPGADLSLVAPRFVHWLLSDLLPKVKNKQTRESFDIVIGLYRRWIDADKPSETEWSEAYRIAGSDGPPAGYAADAARDAARYAARYAAADDACYAARYAAAVEAQADKLIELLQGAPLGTANANHEANS